MAEKVDQREGLEDRGSIVTLAGMYEEYFLDYASYVILERAIPNVEDGLKPVQRRILYSMREQEDGRFHKVANIIGNTMQYHPHGDAAIGDALVKLGQRDLLVETQGNWGDTRTGDSSAAPRYIEARLSKFALDVAFNKETTEWQVSYDGRKNEPITLPMKFPLLLAQGAEGIAVGLSTKVMPHNLGELIKASIRILQDKRFQLYPDFSTGGSMDVEQYANGKRGGKLAVRARIEKVDKNSIRITELPYGITTGSLIDSIVKASDKGKIKIKKITDNTAKDVEIVIELASGVSPEQTIDALYAFTNCAISISPNACIIIDNKPHFLSVNEILRISTDRTKDLLRQELEIKRNATQEKWHFASLEKIFIENRVYREIEECETWEAVLETIDKEMRKYICTPGDGNSGKDGRLQLNREFTEEDIVRLTEIKIKRISKFNSYKADEYIAGLNETLAQINHDLANLTEYAVAYFENLYQKYGKDSPRRTQITSFEDINVVQVVANNAKLYVNRKDGFIGSGMRKEEFIRDCSDLDDIIAFKKDGTFRVSRIADKVFMGKNILHVDVWKRGDERSTYNLIYLDGKTGRAMAKRFAVSAITRDKDYTLTKGSKGSKLLYFQAHPNGESEVVTIQLSPGCRAKKKVFDFDFASLDIKGRGAGGNIVTKYPVRKITQTSIGQSTLGAIQYWIDQASGRINSEEMGTYLGEFDTGDLIIALHEQGTYTLYDPAPLMRIPHEGLIHVGKLNPKTVVYAVHYDSEKKWTMVKRFQVETTSLGQPFSFISENARSKLLFATTLSGVKISFSYMSGKQKVSDSLALDEFIDVKGWKALGNKLVDKLIKGIQSEEPAKTADEQATSTELKPGDTIQFDLN
ncbi:MAG: DNA gyrase/topoisomerase IV subunit A [Saprospiraceae bacterium]|nr:DNA gyrase/topoisomerase IV subunit A [Saprospiraceae bacterium]